MYVMLSVLTVATALFSTSINETNTRLDNMQECKAFLEHRKSKASKDDKVEVTEDSLTMQRSLGFLATWNSIYVCKEFKE